MTQRWFYGLVAALMCMNGAAQAEEYLAIYGGAIGVGNGSAVGKAGVEYRFDPLPQPMVGWLPKWGQAVRPVLGMNVDYDSALYGYTGVSWDIKPFENKAITLSPNWAAGLYRKAAGRDLGGAIEFRTGLEASYEMDDAARIGIAFNHLSNAGIYDENPGSESLIAVYNRPVNFFDFW